MISWTWQPLVCVGPIKFGEASRTLAAVPGMRLEKLERSDEQLWSDYWSEQDGVSVMCLDGRIISVACHDSFLYRGMNLVGMPDPTMRMQFRDQRMSVGEFPDGYTLEVAELGLELTIQNDLVLIATAFDEPLEPTTESSEAARR